MSLYQQTITIHSAIADPGNFNDRRGAAAVALWYWVRACDQQGTGRAVFALDDAAQGLEKSIPTIRRYLKDGLKLGLFRSAKTEKGIATVYYSSLKNVALKNGLMQLGGFAEINVSDLKNLKFWAVQLAAQVLQESSRWLAKLGTKRATVEPEKIVSASPDSRGANGILHKGKRCTFVTSQFVMFGVSLKSLARHAGRSFATVQRRLSNSYREARGVEAIAKTQLAQLVPDNGEARFLQSEGALEGDRLFHVGGNTYRAGCTVYERSFQVKAGKVAKYLFKRAIAQEFSTVRVGN